MRLVEIPLCVTHRSLRLARNAFTGGLPSNFSTLSALAVIDFSSNRLSGTLDVLTTVTAVRDVNLESNAFSGTLPAGLAGLTRLADLRVGGNDLVGALPALSALPLLRRLDVRRNRLSGTIPAGLFASPATLTYALPHSR